MKKLIRLTENDVHKIVIESVNRILERRKAIVSERIKGEKGMSDDEVIYRRNRNFEKDCDYIPNKLHQDPFTPNYSDRLEMEAPYHTPEEMEMKVSSDRLKRHHATQKIHKPKLKNTLFKEAVSNDNDYWYAEEDYDGNTGEHGMVRSYDVGTYYYSNAEVDAKENGFNNVEDYLKYYFDEIRSDCPWYWKRIGSGYGYKGNVIFREGGLVCKDIYGQIMFDEYPISQADYEEDFNNRLNKGEYYAK